MALSTPNITPAQAVAIVGSVIAVIVAAGLPLSKDLQDSILRLVEVLAPLLLASDAVIRHGRAHFAGKKALADAVRSSGASNVQVS